MEQPSKEYIREQLYEAGILPMFSHADPEISLEILQALYNAGIRVVEFTNRPIDALKIFKNLKKMACEKMPGLLLGAGTILNKEDAISFFGEGADFLVAPITDSRVASYCIQNNLFWCPGAATLTEIVQAHELGADLVKVFPAEQLGGPAYIKAIMAPCPWIRVIPTGGIKADPATLPPWFEAGARVLGLSSQLFSAGILQHGDYKKLTERVGEILRFIQTMRKN
jgi:2-dehydro-3-deoxyphosphogluconate aldolase / (4S)-4-hydroxy-2-oxoglutarate aldolase